MSFNNTLRYFIIEFSVELIEIIKVNIMLLAPFMVPLFIGYIIGKIYLHNNMYYENLETKIIEINQKMINCEKILYESKENNHLYLHEIGVVIDNKYSTITKELESMKVHVAILNELVYSELQNSNISRTKYYNK